MESCICNMGFMFSFTYEWYGARRMDLDIYFSMCIFLTTHLCNEKDKCVTFCEGILKAAGRGFHET